ncbi:MAG: hypothetical protein ACRC2T_07525 [Thermoguttaceae bacterium]
MFAGIKKFYDNRPIFWMTVILLFLIVEFSLYILPPPIILTVCLASGIVTLFAGSCIIGEQINALKTLAFTNKTVLLLLRLGQLSAVTIGVLLLAFTGYVYLTSTTSRLFSYGGLKNEMTFFSGTFIIVCPIIVWKTVIVMQEAVVALRRLTEETSATERELCVSARKTAWINLTVIGAVIGMFVFYFVSKTYLYNLRLIADGRSPNNYIDTSPYISLRLVFFIYLICLTVRGTWRFTLRKMVSADFTSIEKGNGEIVCTNETESTQPHFIWLNRFLCILLLLACTTINFPIRISVIAIIFVISLVIFWSFFSKNCSAGAKRGISITISWLLVALMLGAINFNMNLNEGGYTIGGGDPFARGLFELVYCALNLLYYHLATLVAVLSIRLQIATIQSQNILMTFAVILAMFALGLGL